MLEPIPREWPFQPGDRVHFQNEAGIVQSMGHLDGDERHYIIVLESGQVDAAERELTRIIE